MANKSAGRVAVPIAPEPGVRPVIAQAPSGTANMASTASAIAVLPLAHSGVDPVGSGRGGIAAVCGTGPIASGLGNPLSGSRESDKAC